MKNFKHMPEWKGGNNESSVSLTGVNNACHTCAHTGVRPRVYASTHIHTYTYMHMLGFSAADAQCQVVCSYFKSSTEGRIKSLRSTDSPEYQRSGQREDCAPQWLSGPSFGPSGSLFCAVKVLLIARHGGAHL